VFVGYSRFKIAAAGGFVLDARVLMSCRFAGYVSLYGVVLPPFEF
jgi:hypothetical protein